MAFKPPLSKTASGIPGLRKNSQSNGHVSPPPSFNSPSRQDSTGSDYQSAGTLTFGGAERVKVVVRVRPALRSDEEGGAVTVTEEGKKLSLSRPDSVVTQSEHAYDTVLPNTATQQDVYMAAVKDVVDDVLKGYNGTVMAYGQTGAGKTHTIGSIQPKAIGMIPRAVAEIFKRAQEDRDNVYSVGMSYIQIYMELLQDLLNPKSDNMQIREDHSGVFVSGVHEVKVSSMEECLGFLELGEKNRAFAFTHLNAHSSRSHAVVMLTVTQRARHLSARESTEMKALEKDGVVPQKVKVGKLFLVDLAGSERLKKSKSVGIRANEAISINLSLTTLGMCINARATDSAHVPFRDSKLTRLLQESLGGNAKTTLIVCVADVKAHVDETLMSLQFASRAMCVKNKPRVNERIDYKSLQDEILSQLNTDQHQERRKELTAELFRQDYEILQKERDQFRLIAEALTNERQEEEDRRVRMLHEKEQELRAHQQQLKQRQQELEEHRRQQKQLSETVQELKREKDQFLRKAEVMTKEKEEEMRGLLEHKEQDLQQARRELAVHQQAVEELRKAMEESRKALEKAKADQEALERQNSKLQKQVASSAEATQQVQQEAEEQLEDLRNQLEQERRRQAELRNQVQHEADGQLEDLRNQLEQERQLQASALAAARKAHKDEVKTISSKHEEVVSGLLEKQTSGLKQLVGQHAEEMKSLGEKMAQAEELHFAELRSLRESHAQRIKGLQGEIEELRSAHVGEISSMQEAHALRVRGLESEIAEMRKAHGGELRALREAHGREVEALKEEHSQRVKGIEGDAGEMRRAHVHEVEALKEAHVQKVKGLEGEMAEMRRLHGREVEALKEEHMYKARSVEGEVEEMKKAHGGEIKAVKEAHRQHMESMREEIEQLRSDFSKALEAEVAKREADGRSMEEKHAEREGKLVREMQEAAGRHTEREGRLLREMREAAEKHAQELRELRSQMSHDVAKVEERRDTEVSSLKATHSKELEAVRGRLEEVIADLKTELMTAAERHMAETDRLQSKHSAEVADLRAHVKQLQDEHMSNVRQLQESREFGHRELLDTHGSEIRRLKAEHQSDLAEVMGRLQGAQETQHRLQEEIAMLSGTVKSLRSDKGALEEQSRQQVDLIASLHSSVAQLQSSMVDLVAQCSREAMSREAKLAEAIGQKGRALDGLQKQVGKVSTQLSSLQKQRRQLLSTRDHLAQQVAHLQAQGKTLEGALAARAKEAEGLKGELEESRRDGEALRGELEDLSLEVDSKEEENEELRGRVEGLQRTLEGLEAELEVGRRHRHTLEHKLERANSDHMHALSFRARLRRQHNAAAVIQRAWRQHCKNKLVSNLKQGNHALDQTIKKVSKLEQYTQDLQAAQNETQVSFGQNLVQRSMTTMRDGVSNVLAAFLLPKKELQARLSAQQRIQRMSPHSSSNGFNAVTPRSLSLTPRRFSGSSTATTVTPRTPPHQRPPLSPLTSNVPKNPFGRAG